MCLKFETHHGIKVRWQPYPQKYKFSSGKSMAPKHFEDEIVATNHNQLQSTFLGRGSGCETETMMSRSEGAGKAFGPWGRGVHGRWAMCNVLLCRCVHGPGGRGEPGWPMLFLLGWPSGSLAQHEWS